MYCPICASEMEYTGRFNLYGGGDYICRDCKKEVSVLFEDLPEEEEEE